jgi:hypothetical protein
MLKRSILAVAAVLPLSLAVAACHQEGPAERAGSSLDRAGRSIGDTLDPPKGPAQSTGRSIDRALGQ